MEMTKCPWFLRKLWALSETILAWSGWATSANIVSTIPTNNRESLKLSDKKSFPKVFSKLPNVGLEPTTQCPCIEQ